MACNSLTQAYTRGCENNLASGVRGFALRNWERGTTYLQDANGVVTGATDYSGGSTVNDSFYSIEQRTGVAEYRENLTVNAQYGSRTFVPEIVITFLGQSQSVRNIANDIAQGIFDALVELESGEWILLEKMEASSGLADPGVSADDPTIIQVTLTGRARQYADTVNASTVTTFVA